MPGCITLRGVFAVVDRIMGWLVGLSPFFLVTILGFACGLDMFVDLCIQGLLSGPALLHIQAGSLGMASAGRCSC